MKYFSLLCTFLFSNAVFAFACESNYPPSNMEQGTNPLFITAGRRGFTANVMTQHFYWLFKKAGIDGASSHTMRRSFIHCNT